eukprot:4422436-Pleurochrysis_carterae.AAC.1
MAAGGTCAVEPSHLPSRTAVHVHTPTAVRVQNRHRPTFRLSAEPSSGARSASVRQASWRRGALTRSPRGQHNKPTKAKRTCEAVHARVRALECACVCVRMRRVAPALRRCGRPRLGCPACGRAASPLGAGSASRIERQGGVPDEGTRASTLGTACTADGDKERRKAGWMHVGFAKDKKRPNSEVGRSGMHFRTAGVEIEEGSGVGEGFGEGGCRRGRLKTSGAGGAPGATILALAAAAAA